MRIPTRRGGSLEKRETKGPAGIARHPIPIYVPGSPQPGLFSEDDADFLGKRMARRFLPCRQDKQGGDVDMRTLLYSVAAAMTIAGSALAGDCCGCQCPLGKMAFALKANASAPKVVCVDNASILKNLARV